MSNNGTTERLVKSTGRVRDLGEVFTPANTVAAMLDLLPEEMWAVHPAPTFLEPACGDGNFLVAILNRKLARVLEQFDDTALPAGNDRDGLAFHFLEALSSIYAIDISPENIVGGTPGHEVGARDRMLDMFARWWLNVADQRLTDRNVLFGCARWIVEHNIIVGNMLETDAQGRPSGREKLPLVEYTWDSGAGQVTTTTTTLGAVIEAGETSSTGVQSLFANFDAEPAMSWTVAASGVRGIPIPCPDVPRGLVRNSNRRR
ncbi:MAG: hypothetical protein GY701_11010 [Sulfitobacter sp.]|nr:hypothetical protein [Sulfitobacter sp.]